jgi:class 3 adenylate cyclase/tetratricopeptide (TPR) repeat protein
VSSTLGTRLASGRPLADAESSQIHGALLLTDIEGWTSRVEELCGIGPEGLDELARTLNAYFVRLTEIVYGHGGDLLTATGDAFLCCWQADDEASLTEATLRAAQAGLAFQAAHDGLELRTRIGIATGALELALVGGVNGRWELLPIGAPLDDVAIAERAAPAGSVALAPSAWSRIADRAQGDALDGSDLVLLSSLRKPPDPAGVADRADIDADAIAPFVPAPVRGWRADSGTEWLAELRPLTVVMARLLDAGGGSLEELERNQLAVRAFQETIARFEGASKPGMDNKGLTLSGAFGLPPRAHEDDAKRALRAATAVREALAALQLPCSVGVASGRAFCGLFGNDLRREYLLHGDVANLAARLAYAGDGEILCDEVTAQAAGERFEFEDLPPMPVKGRAEPVPIRRLTGMGAAVAPRHSSLVDRESERALIARRIEALATDGEPAAIVVEGDAGIGKSALAAEAARMAQRSGVRVLTAASDAVERATGYYAWRPVFADVLGLDGEPADPARLQRVVLEQVGGAPEIERLTPLLSSVLPTPIPDNDVTAAMTGEVRADNTTMLLTRILSRCTASEPVLLIVEDGHWLDSNSLSLLSEVVRTVPRLLALVLTRPLEPGSEVLAVASDAPIRLSSLAAEHTALLVCQRLGVANVPAELSRFVEQRVAGHPFFCEALLKAMQERGVVRIEDGAPVVGDLDTVDVPSTVEGAVLSLVDRLTPPQQLSLKVAAVVGHSFSTRTVSEAHPVDSERPSVPDDLRALVALDLIVPESAEADPSYAFRHDITRSVAYGLLTESQRRPLHRAVADWYETNHGEDELVPHHALLAHHWAEADDAAKAITYLEMAARQALRSGAFREAIHFYRQLDALAPPETDPARRALWEKGEATAQYFLGDFDRSRELLERAVCRLDRPVPKNTLPLARGLLEATATQVAHLVLPGRFHDRRRAEKAVLDEVVDCYKILGQISYLNGESPAELVYVECASLNIGEEAGSSPALAQALANAAGVASLMNLRRLADRYLARAVRMGEAEGQSEALAYVWNINGLIEAQRGGWRKGIAANDRALEAFGEIGDYNLEAEIWQTRSALYLCAGDFRGAEPCWTRTREFAARNENPQLECWSWLDEVQTQVGRGDVEAAGRALDASLAIETAASDGGTLIEKHCSTAATRLLEGRHDEAVAAADAVIEMVTAQQPTGWVWADFTAGALEVYLDLGEQRRAGAALKALRKLAWTFHGVRPRRSLLAGRLEWERGRHDRAVKAWRKAEAAAKAMSMDYDVARARLELVRHGAGDASMRAQAIATFEALGADHHLQIARNA